MPGSSIIDVYKNIYNLQEITYKEKVDFDFFRLCRQNHNFAVVCIYNEKRELLLIRDLNKNIGWELVGGYIEKSEKLEDAVNRIVLKEAGLEIDELQPIAILNNVFEYKGRIILHKGIAFVAFARGSVKEQPKNIKAIFTKEIPEVVVYQNKEIIKVAQKIIENKFFDPPYEEIKSGKRFIIPHIINKYFVRIIGRYASKKIRKKTIELILGVPESIVDLCCGDDDFIFYLEKKYNPKICIANDISWRVLSLLNRKIKNGNVILTNHNVIDFPVVTNRKFDLAIFKNSLHHIPFDQQADLIKSISEITKQLIIIDIEDPKRSDFITKIWHWYYVYFLGDQGGYFFTLFEANELMKTIAKNKDIISGIINTIKGRYFYISISEQKKKEEVEIKASIDRSEIKDIRKKLVFLGAEFKGKTKEKDTYFTAPHRDFIKTKECLRIREKDDCAELTYKGQSTGEMIETKQFWKEEIDIPISSIYARKLESLFISLDFRIVARVIKEREKFIIGNQILTIDNIENLGYFLEVEKNIEKQEEREVALKENMNLLKKLGIGEENVITEPYRDLVINRNNTQLT
jgi:adenylate cyclase class 2